MEIRKLIHGALAAAALVVVTGSAAMAQTTEFPIANSAGNDQALNVTYNPTTGFLLSSPTGGIYHILSDVGLGSDLDADVVLGPLTPTGPYTFNSGTGAFSEGLSGSSFTITDDATHTVLLSGTFGSSTLSGNNNSSSGGVALTTNSVTYTGGTFFPTGTYSPLNGNLGITFTSAAAVGGGPLAGTNGVNAFSAHDAIDFSAPKLPPSVPEPGTYAAFLMGGLGVLGLMIGARKRSLVA
jgi:hypothetical protein